MSKLIKKLAVPENARVDRICPIALNIYSDKVESVGGRGETWFFKDYLGIDIAKASITCGFSGVRFITKENATNYPKKGFPMLNDKNRVNFCSGVFSYKAANDFAQTAYAEIKNAFEKYKKNKQFGAIF